jgi:hypothetical protein
VVLVHGFWPMGKLKASIVHQTLDLNKKTWYNLSTIIEFIRQTRRRPKGITMVKTLDIKCPSCSQNFTLYLTIDTSMVILDCPTCCSSIIFYKSRSFSLSKSQIDRIKKCKQESSVLKILHRITGQETKVRCLHHKEKHYHSEARSINKQVPMFKSNLDFITQDDIVNLRIELETCKDAGNFIENI